MKKPEATHRKVNSYVPEAGGYRLPRIRGGSCTMCWMRRSRHLARYSLPPCSSLPGEVFLLSLSMYITSLQRAPEKDYCPW